MLIVVKTLCALLQMGLEQFADENRAMEQHYNTLWDVHLRQVRCDAKHLFESCQRNPLISLFVCGLVFIVGFARHIQNLLNHSQGGGIPAVSGIKRINQFTCYFSPNSSK